MPNQSQQEDSHSYQVILQFKCKAPLLLKTLTTLTNKATDIDLAEDANTPLLLKLLTTPYWRNHW